MRTVLARTAGAIASLKLTCVLLVLLGVLTWLGTLEQTRSGLYEVQRRYFESYVLVHHAGPVPIPLPGANLVLSLLFVNLLAGGLARLRKSRETAGILVAHTGIALLLVAAFVRHRYAHDGQVTLREGERSSTFESPTRAELAIVESIGEGSLRETLVAHEILARAEIEGAVRIEPAGVPFAIEVESFLPNARPRVASPHGSPVEKAIDGVWLESRPREPEAERNIPGARLAIVDAASGVRRQALTWIAEERPFTFVAAGRSWSVGLRRERHELPFEIALQRFEKEDHPRTGLAKSFESDVTITEDGVPRATTISMNEPLRAGGVVVYQASWGPQGAAPGARLFSTFAVARNPADSLPLVALSIVALGLAWHFGSRLVRWMRIEGGRARA